MCVSDKNMYISKEPSDQLIYDIYNNKKDNIFFLLPDSYSSITIYTNFIIFMIKNKN